MEVLMMMSSQDSAHDPAARYHYYGDHRDDDGGGAGGTGFLEMFGDLHSSGSGDLFELVWQGGAVPAARTETSTTMQEDAGDCSLMTSSLPPSGHQPRRPSEDEMASWLRPIIVGDDGNVVEPPAAVVVGLGKPAGGGGGVAERAAEEDDRQPVAAPAEGTTKTEAKCTVDTGSNCRQRRKQRGRRCHHSETHKLTEKRRRWKINEKFRTLQRLVPGCDDKSNQTSTLEQTIKHMNSLQHQIQAMTFGCRIAPPAAVYPVVVPPPPPYYLPAAAMAGGAALPLPAATAFAPGAVMKGGNVWPGMVLAPPPPPAMLSSLPFAAATYAPIANGGEAAAGSAF